MTTKAEQEAQSLDQNQSAITSAGGSAWKKVDQMQGMMSSATSVANSIQSHRSGDRTAVLIGAIVDTANSGATKKNLALNAKTVIDKRAVGRVVSELGRKTLSMLRSGSI